MKALLIVLFTLALFGCSQSDEFATDLREYNINNLHTVVGVGKWKDNKFVIQSLYSAKRNTRRTFSVAPKGN